MTIIGKIISKIAITCFGTWATRIPLCAPIYRIVWSIFGLKNIDLVNVLDFKMYVDYKDAVLAPYLARKGCWEPFETQIFEEQIKPGMVVVDLGASIGYYSLAASRLVGETGKVYAFEPYPDSFNLLVKNIEVNRFTNIVPVQKAISDKAGTSRLHLSTEPAMNTLSSSLTISHRGYVEVSITTLDEYFGDNKVDVIKMDIEGSESLALKGMRNVIKHNPNLKLITEVYPERLKGLGSSLANYIDELKEYFDLSVINERKNRLEPYTGLNQITSIKNAANLLCTRKEAK